MELLTQTHYSKLLSTFTRTNRSVIADFIQHKLYLLFLKEYFLNPNLLKEKRKIIGKGRTSNRITQLLVSREPSLFDHVFCYV